MKFDCVIIGAGFAGAATAYHLAREGMGRILLVEQEPVAGAHASGRNAAMVRQVLSDEAIAALAHQGAQFISSLNTGATGIENFRATGSLLLASGRALQKLRSAMDEARGRGVPAGLWERARAEARVAALRGSRFEAAVFTDSDGIVDLHELLQHYLKGAQARGATFLPGVRVTELLTEGNRRVRGLRAGTQEFLTPRVVNAAGAWAGRIGKLAGAARIAISPYRRHLFYSGPYPEVDRSWPFVWDLEHDLYFRPESYGLLLSPCDEDAAEPGVPATDPAALELLGMKIGKAFPSLQEVPIAGSWTGLRTFAPDRRFVIGPDPVMEGFFWVAALGGHGVTTSNAVGALAAALICDPTRDGDNPFSPSRFGA